MANIDAALGLRAVTSQAGTTPSMHEYEADAGGANIAEGQIVVLIAGSGTDNEVVNGWDGAAGTGVNMIGVAAQKRLTADAARTLLVYDDPDQEYEIQVDDGSITHASDLVASLFAVIAATGRNTLTDQSTSELDGSSATATESGTVPLLGLRLGRDPENDFTTANPNVVVRLNDFNLVMRRGVKLA